MIEGTKYHKITIGPEVIGAIGGRRFVYHCDCGVTKTVLLQHIKNQRPKSCGCMTGEILANAQRTHGMEHTVEYTAWKHMKARCLLRTRLDYKHYGGRGISFCARWLKFENFFQDMGYRPDGMSLDRIDVNGDYDPENCRWATSKQQANNRRKNNLITAQGRTQTSAMWADELGMKPDTLRHRLRRGWDHETAIALPLGGIP